MEPTENSTTNSSNNNSGPASGKPAASQGKKVGITIAVIAILALIGITVASDKKSAEQAMPVDTTTDTTQQNMPTTTALFKDGTYTATGSYISPGGADQVGVSVTLKNDIITDATVTPMPGDAESAHYQGIFAANYKPLVIGMDITKLNVHKVSGSSLTSQGFNDAITKIEAQAKA